MGSWANRSGADSGDDDIVCIDMKDAEQNCLQVPRP